MTPSLTKQDKKQDGQDRKQQDKQDVTYAIA
jgi:hypothetical protein